MNTKQRTFWDSMHAETLIHEDPDDAIEEHLDCLYPADIAAFGEVTVYEYKPMEVTFPLYCSPLEHVLEILDEEYGNPDGPDDQANDAMRRAEKAFLEVVLENYQPWACELTGEKITVNALEWVREHRPDWLEKTQPHRDGGRNASNSS